MKTPDTVELLRQVGELIAIKENWAQGYTVLTRDNKPVSSTHPDAHSFCILGACMYVANANRQKLGYENVVNALIDSISVQIPSRCFRNIAFFNDSPETKHSDVMDVLNEAVKHASKF